MYNWKNWGKHGKPIIDLGPDEKAFDSVLACLPCVVKDQGKYKLWYSGLDEKRTWRIGLATSLDGISFMKCPESPVLDIDPHGWDSHGVGYCAVLKEEVYKMWYIGFDKTNACMGLAMSDDGIHWTKKPEPVMKFGAPGEFDEKMILRPGIIRDGNIYRMAYPGLRNNGLMTIGVAMSPDGLKWMKNPMNPVLVNGPEEWDMDGIEDAGLIKLGRRYYLTYSGRNKKQNYRIGLAISSGGVNFSKVKDPIIDLGEVGSFEDTFVAGNFVMEVGGRLVMYYHGRDAHVRERITVAWAGAK